MFISASSENSQHTYRTQATVDQHSWNLVCVTFIEQLTTRGSKSVFGLTLMELSCFHGYSLLTRRLYSSTFVNLNQLNVQLEAELSDQTPLLTE